MRQDTICDFVLDTDSMLAWYSSDIKVYYMLYWDKDDGENCRASPNAEFKEYKKNTPFIMGQKDQRGSTDGALCLVKYMVDNDNTYSDLRIQIFKMSDGDDAGNKQLMFTTMLAFISMVVWFV